MSDFRRMGSRSRSEKGERNYHILRIITAVACFYFTYVLYKNVQIQDTSVNPISSYVFMVFFVIIGIAMIVLFIRDFGKLKEDEEKINERNKQEKQLMEEKRQKERYLRKMGFNNSGKSLSEKASAVTRKQGDSDQDDTANKSKEV